MAIVVPHNGDSPIEDEREPFEQQLHKARESGASQDDTRYESGFLEGFTRARQIFWRDIARRAIEAREMAAGIRANNGDPVAASQLDTMAAAYSNCADLLSKSHSLYPGALQEALSPEESTPENRTLYYY